jgi:hypothetical protein
MDGGFVCTHLYQPLHDWIKPCKRPLHGLLTIYMKQQDKV